MWLHLHFLSPCDSDQVCAAGPVDSTKWIASHFPLAFPLPFSRTGRTS